ncbi:MAG: tyrosine-type recombinase/integrase [Alphaproteobacteria bacterium]|uniref:Putative site-specific tyrosine recombinase n=1 Tax=viral metagenome TaxID=1070528 RepID=A0A6H1ZH53_9ZZZZ|nr:tyrosine-type recombinase/integrase [Alphaproteobacteria bacterium]MBU0803574.1 tyrosine-type recombinase/integrase [Alphaproteobacteria bacterium]MBU0873129.1 tyrosine-type recombinase/integrase [Alphaproteobacteria bacterium]MBU1402502.1 tyrosine-type recombinase/integrase [Alphaproteobacteria bacterium]MBU1593143.1 tyrosine-type recombinase/integrase [Alphaproteobacteria bacterium]
MTKRLTATVLGALRAKDTAYYVPDDQQVGLRVRVAPSGSLTWNVAFRIKGGSTKSVSLGPCDPNGRRGFGLAEARERASEIVKAARQGRDLLTEEQDARLALEDRLSVDTLIERYTKSINSPNRNGGALRTAGEIERRLIRALSSKLNSVADNLKRADISVLLDEVADKFPREAEKRRQSIGAMYRWGVAKGYVSTDPTAGSESYGRGGPRDRVLSPEEIRAFWTWLDTGAQNMPPDCIAALRLQLCTGARIGEVAGIHVSELHQEDETLVWTLPASRSKNKNQRVTPLVGKARAIVEGVTAQRNRGALFKTAQSGRPLTSTDIGQALKKRHLPCPHFSSHDLRRTVVSMMDELGIALDTIAAVVGHQRGSRDTRTLVRHYGRARLDERVEAALTAWDQYLGSIISGSIEPAGNVLRLRGTR